MDFFEQQERAKKRSFRLTLLYIAGILLLALLATLAIELILYGTSGIPGSEQAALRQGPPFYVDFLLLVGVLSAFLGITGLFRYLTIRAGGHKVAQSLHGRQVVPQTTDVAERRLLNIVEELALASGMPVPGVYVLDQELGINAFAAGYSVNDAVIGVTRGALDQLSRDELQAVIGHEFSHIQNGDMRLNMRFAALLFGLLCLTEIARLITHFTGGGGGNDSKNRGAILLVALVLYLTGLLMSLWGRLIQAAINREHEYLADATSVQFTRSTALASALKKIGGLEQGSKLEASGAPNYDHLFFGQTYGGLFATHPPLKKRIQALEPDWDGRFIAPKDIPVRAESPLADNRVDVSPAAAAYSPNDPWARLRSTPAAAVAAMAGAAALAGQGVAQPVQPVSALDKLTAACHEPLDAGYIILALLLDDDAQIQEIQASLTPNRPLLEEYYGLLQSIAEGKRLELAELCIPALKLLSEGQYRDLVRIMQHMIEADQVRTFREWLIAQFVEQNVGVVFRKKAMERQLYNNPAQIREELGLAFSAFASLTEAELAPQAFAQAAKALGLPDLVYTGQPDAQTLEASLDKIRRASDAVRASFLQAARAILEYDDMIIQQEKMLYRLVALYLDLPAEQTV